MKKMFLCLLFAFSISLAHSQVCSSCNASGWDLSVPPGTNQTYTVPSLSGATYVWVVTGGLNIVSGQGSTSVTIQVNGTGSLYVTRYKSGHSACANKATVTAEIDCEMLINHEPCYTTHLTGCPVSGAASYKWYVNGVYHGQGNINSNGSHWAELGFLNAGNPNYYHLRNTNITVCAKAYSSAGFYLGEDCETYFAFCFFKLNQGQDENQPRFGTDVEIYPNPASAQSAITFDNLPLESIKSIRLLNQNGQVIQSFATPSSNTLRLDETIPMTGLYLLQFETIEGLISKKLMLR